MVTLPAHAVLEAMYGENPEKAAAAAERFELHEVLDPGSFDLGYRLLERQFGPINEIERREILERWSTHETLAPPGARLSPRYHMLLVRDRDGRVAALRDGFSVVDAAARRVVAFLSHSLVLPEWRRSGAAALLRAAPVFFARREAAAAGVPDARPLLVAEMEPVDPTVAASVVRLLSYGRAGFRIVPPSSAPYAQPDFRDLDVLGVAAVPIPMMLVVRQVGADERAVLDWSDLAGIMESLAAIHRPAVHPAQLPEIHANTARYRPPGDEPPIRLVHVRQVADLLPLLRSAVLPHYPPAWHGPAPGDPLDERRVLFETWKETA